MSSHYEWGDARAGLYQIVSREAAPEEWDLPAPGNHDVFSAGVTASHALGLFNANGDGTVLEGEPGEILDYVDLLHAYTHRELDALVDYGTRPGAHCGHRAPLTARAASAAVTIPGDVWRAFLAQETTLDDEHPGAVSLSAVVGELLGMIAERGQADATQ